MAVAIAALPAGILVPEAEFPVSIGGVTTRVNYGDLEAKVLATFGNTSAMQPITGAGLTDAEILATRNIRLSHDGVGAAAMALPVDASYTVGDSYNFYSLPLLTTAITATVGDGSVTELTTTGLAAGGISTDYTYSVATTAVVGDTLSVVGADGSTGTATLVVGLAGSVLMSNGAELSYTTVAILADSVTSGVLTVTSTSITDKLTVTVANQSLTFDIPTASVVQTPASTDFVLDTPNAVLKLVFDGINWLKVA